MKKKMMKTLAVLLAVLTVCTIYAPLSADAASASGKTPLVYAVNVRAKAGSQAKVDVYLKNNPGVAGYVVEIDYDPDVLTAPVRKNAQGQKECTAVRGEVCLSGTFISAPVDGKQGKIKTVWSSGINSSADGKLFSIPFNVARNAADGDYKIRVSIADREFSDSRGKFLKVSTAAGKVTVGKWVYGDVNDDGKIDVKDVVRISRHLAGLQTLTGKALSAADVNGDGSVHVNDVIKLSRYLVGLEISLGPDTVPEPSEPSDPGKPDTPDKPDKPDVPDVPDKPDTPEKPDKDSKAVFGIVVDKAKNNSDAGAEYDLLIDGKAETKNGTDASGANHYGVPTDETGVLYLIRFDSAGDVKEFASWKDGSDDAVMAEVSGGFITYSKNTVFIEQSGASFTLIDENDVAATADQITLDKNVIVYVNDGGDWGTGSTSDLRNLSARDYDKIAAYDIAGEDSLFDILLLYK